MIANKKGYVVMQSGEVYEGRWRGGESRAGELVFNTSASGYEEIATDPSYFSQIMIMTSPMMGNYGARGEWESKQIHIQGFVSLEIQDTERDHSWLQSLTSSGVPVVTDIDTRSITMKIRDSGTPWGALVQANSDDEARAYAHDIIKKRQTLEKDWVHLVSRKNKEIRKGEMTAGPRIAVVDFGVKENIVRELVARSQEVAIFPSRVLCREIRDWNPDGIVLTNGPGDPGDVKQAVETTRELLGWKPIFGICMGHQILSLALGGRTFKMTFGHRGGNHPVKDHVLNEIYMTSQNHGYTVDPESLPPETRVTHVNLYDKTVEGISHAKQKCMSVQFHPENCPGPRDARGLFDFFKDQLL